MESWPQIPHPRTHGDNSWATAMFLRAAEQLRGGSGALRVDWDRKGGAGGREAVSSSTEKEGL